jgi:hypothetical protein
MAKLGQFFILSALVVSLLMFTVLVSFSQTQSSGSDRTSSLLIENYFSSLPETFSQSSAQGLSPTESVYKQNMFFNTSFSKRGYSFSAAHVLLLPDKNEAAVINYGPESETVRLEAEDSNEVTVRPYQTENISFSRNSSYRVVFTNLGSSESFVSDHKSLVTGVSLSSDQGVIRDTRIQ